MDTHQPRSVPGRQRASARRLIDELLESLRLKLARARYPKRSYFLRLPTEPISRSFGSDRGTPIDRYYIERFLEQNRSYVRGTCMEVQNSDYTHRFGRDLGRVDVL